MILRDPAERAGHFIDGVSLLLLQAVVARSFPGDRVYGNCTSDLPRSFCLSSKSNPTEATGVCGAFIEYNDHRRASVDDVTLREPN